MAYRSDYSLPPEVDEEVKRCLPNLFTHHKSVLYIGANWLRQHFLHEFVQIYDHVTLIEIYKENVDYLKDRYREKNVRIIHGDVRQIGKLDEMFDVCFFWHGPEHIAKNEVPSVLKTLETHARYLVVCGMPYGHYRQGSEYGNEHETHLWDIYPRDMKDLGYETNHIGRINDSHANMMAWKRMAPLYRTA